MLDSPRASHPHPRRAPPHLSVSLRRESASNVTKSEAPSTRPDAKGLPAKNRTPGRKPAKRPSNDSSDSAEGSGAQGWFDSSNKHPSVQLNQTYRDGEPPFYMPNDSSDGSDEKDTRARHVATAGIRAQRVQAAPLSAASSPTGSSAEDYRSVIDDLTIENKKLKARLRRYENSYYPSLEKDSLFEIKIHGLPAKKRRELEKTLRAFVAAIEDPSGAVRIKPTSSRTHLSENSDSMNPSSSSFSNSNSNSRPGDSAYASMSTSAPHLSSEEKQPEPATQQTKERKVQSFLHNIPEAFLPKRTSVTTEKQKKRAVVRRLEQLFTGNVGKAGEHSHPLQQQEVSKSAAIAERRPAPGPLAAEGHREANILPFEMDVDDSKPARGSDDAPNMSQLSRQISYPTADDKMDSSASPNQRPTRPLDLDPDRAQIPSDNVGYLRHLGVSTPQFALQESTDAAADAEGWIYLNLLVNMAQLHIINVTPDFVRSALTDVSEKFQISEDGQKVRWRGGTEGTRLSSDSDGNSSRHRSAPGSDLEYTRKRHKIDAGRFVPVRGSSIIGSSHTHAFHYKPLFNHQSSSDDQSSPWESESPYDQGYAFDSETGQGSGLDSRDSRLSRRRQGDEGPIVFYKGGHFFTDLSGDRGHLGTPNHVTGVGQDGYSNHTQDAVGCKSSHQTHSLKRTPSGSFLQFRPFRDYSKGPYYMQAEEPVACTPKQLREGSVDLEIFPGQPSDKTRKVSPLLDLEATGLGGTQPADHFCVQVETCQTRADGKIKSKLSKFSAPSPTSRKFLHGISDSSLDAFRAQTIDDQNPLRAQDSWSRKVGEFPIQTKIRSTHFTQLHPSSLPPPTDYHVAMSSSDEMSDYSDSSSGISRLKKGRAYVERSLASALEGHHLTSSRNSLDSGIGHDDEDGSIDMLAQERLQDPSAVAAREMEFERTVRRTSLDAVSMVASMASVLSSEDEDDAEESSAHDSESD